MSEKQEKLYNVVTKQLEDTNANTGDLKPLNSQVGGTHYQHFKIQPIEFIMANELSFPQGSIVKYICRYPFKNGIEDLEKIKQFVDFLIEEEKAKL